MYIYHRRLFWLILRRPYWTADQRVPMQISEQAKTVISPHVTTAIVLHDTTAVLPTAVWPAAERVVIGDVVWTPDGYGRVVDTPVDKRAVVMVFGEGVYTYALRQLSIVPDDDPRYGIGIVDRQAAIIRTQAERIAALEAQLRRRETKPLSIERGFLQDGD